VAAAAPAAAMTVSPVVLNLSTSGRGMTQTINVENSFATPLAVELRVEELLPDGNGFTSTAKDPGDLLVFPPQAMIQPGQTQAFRVQYVGDPDLARSKHYYVTVAQLPLQRGEGQPNIQVLYNFQVLVSVSPQGAKPALTVPRAEVAATDDRRPAVALTVANTGTAHGYLSEGRLRIVQKDRSGKRLSEKSFAGTDIQQAIGYGLIASGQTRRVIVPIDLAAPDVTVEAFFTPEG
jgi:fimbrial chaperone protein